MGPCFSSTASSGGAASPNLPPVTAKVIAADGTLREYSDAVRAVHVLGGDHPCFFLCDADDLLFDHYIRPLGSNELVEPGRLYFWLPAVKLKYPLTAADMAALVGRASFAITAAGTAFAGVKKRRYWPKKKAVQVTPATAPAAAGDGYYNIANEAAAGSCKVSRNEDSSYVKGEEPLRPRLCY